MATDQMGKSSSFFTINRALLPLKLTLFCFSASAFCVIPYLTIHMKDIGISDIDVALIYTVLPFCVMVAPPIVGFLGDKLGNYTRVLMLNVILCGVFHSFLLLVPPTVRKPIYPEARAVISSSEIQLSWSPTCPTSPSSPSCSLASPLPPSSLLILSNCSVSCTHLPQPEYLSLPPEEQLCKLIPGARCKPNPVAGKVTLRGLLSSELSQTGCGAAVMKMGTKGDPCVASSLEGLVKELVMAEGCRAECDIATKLLHSCGMSDNGNRTLTISTYFILRMLATMCLASVFILLDAQTIQMCKLEEEAGNKGAYGRQIVYKTLAQGLISPLVGLLMDWLTYKTGYTNYLPPFLMCDALLLLTAVSVCFLSTDIGLPKGQDTMKGVKSILTNPNVIIFLIMMFVCGCLLGFVETFLFVFLKEDLNAPIYLLGLTITTGALVSIPALHYSGWIVEKVGMVNVIILALLMYGVRYIGYSYITCAWYAFPFEALEVFTLFLLRVGSAEFVKVNAPPGTLATLNGMSGGMHFGFGKGIGGLAGGVLKDQFGLGMAFWIFGIAGFAFGIIYCLYYYTCGRRIEKRIQERQEKEREKEKLEPFLTAQQNQNDKS